MLLKSNEYVEVNPCDYGAELPKTETPEAKEIGELKIRVNILEEQLKREICNNDCLEKGIIEFVKILGKRSM